MKAAHTKRFATICVAGAIMAGLGSSPCPAAPPDASSASPTLPTSRPTTQPAAEDLASIKKSLADLANSDSAVRSEALTRLMSLPADALPLLHTAVKESEPLVPAQATVLRQIVAQIFLSGEIYDRDPNAGFLGIHMEKVTLNFSDAPLAEHSGISTGIVVTDRMPGFPGARMLHDGDVILSILDRPEISLQTAEDFKAAVTSSGAGAIIHFQILRQGQVIRVPIKLDARPLQADPFMVEELLNRRRQRADEYWSTHFAALTKEGVS